MNATLKTAFALFASFVALGGVAASVAAPAGADSPDCTTACSFQFSQPPSFATGAREVGLQLQSDIPGWIAAICFWEGPGESGGHTVTLWDSAGSEVATATGLGSPGPESCIDFSPPAPISANSTYTASYTAKAGYLVQPGQFSRAFDNLGHLHAPVNAGVLGATGTLPTTGSEGKGYGVDVAFVSTLNELPSDCTSILTAPTMPSTAPGNGSAVVSWGPATADPAGCIAGYLVTPFVDGAEQTSTLVTGLGTTTIVKGLTNGQTYTFTSAAESGRMVGPASEATGPVTVGTPSAPSALSVRRVSAGAVKVAFKARRSNGAAIKSFTATCRSAVGATRSKAGKKSPLIVSGLSAGKKYRCAVRAANRRGNGPESAGSAAV